MPVPTPSSGEDKTKFIGRCHKFLHEENKKRPAGKKWTDEQISTMCYENWRDSKKEDMIRGEAIPILRSFESDGKRYLAGYAALFDSPDCYGTLCTREIVESSWENLKKFPAVRFMHRFPLGQICFDETVKGMSTFVDEHGFHVLVQVYDQCHEEWGMIRSGSWGFSYGLLPAPDGIQTKCLPSGSCYKAFVKGIFYEVSVVDTPAHPQAMAYVVRRLLNGDLGGLSQVGEIEMNKEEIEKLLTDMETRIVKKLKEDDTSAASLTEMEVRITKRVTDAIQAKKEASTTAESLKDMEARILKAVNEKIEKTFPEQKTTQIQQTFDATEKALKVMREKITNLKGIENNLKLAGEDSKAIAKRIVDLEKQYAEFSKTVVASVEKVVETQLVGVERRLSAMENIPEFRSPVTATERAGSVHRGFGFGAMLDAAMGVEEQ